MSKITEKTYLQQLDSQFHAEIKAVDNLCTAYKDYLEKFEEENAYRNIMEVNYKDHIIWQDIRKVEYKDIRKVNYKDIISEKYWKRYFLEPSFTRTLTKDLQEKLADDIITAEALGEFSERNVLHKRNTILNILAEEKKEAILNFFDEIVRSGSEHHWSVEYDENNNGNIKCYLGINLEPAYRLKEDCLTIREQCYCDNGKGDFNTFAAYKLMKKLECLFSYVGTKKHLLIPRRKNVKYSYDRTHANAFNYQKDNGYYDFDGFSLKFYKNGKVRIKLNNTAKFAIRRINLLVGIERGWLPPLDEIVAIHNSVIPNGAKIGVDISQADWEKRKLMQEFCTVADNKWEDLIVPFDWHIHDDLVPGQDTAIVVDCKHDGYVDRRFYTPSEIYMREGIAFDLCRTLADRGLSLTDAKDWVEFGGFDYIETRHLPHNGKIVKIGSDEWVDLLTDENVVISKRNEQLEREVDCIIEQRER